MWETLVQFANEQLANNQFFQGGAFLAVIGILVASLRRLPAKLLQWLRWFSFVTIDIPDKDESFQWVEKWLALQNYTKHRARSLTVYTRRRKYSEDTAIPDIVFSPAPGSHYFFYDKRFVILFRERKEPSQESGSGANMLEREVFTIKILGRKRSVAKKLLEEARKVGLPNAEGKITIHLRESLGHGWRSPLYRPKRPIESVILPNGQSERIVADMETFLHREDWYNERCIPWRRGYLFSGKPGTGKSSLVAALASHFDLGVCIIDFNNIDEYQLLDALSSLPARCILLLEDIDCLYTKRVQSEDNDSNVSFSGMLNALDGVAASEGRIVILTTNKKHMLDKALTRPGRCDVHEYFYDATPDQAARLFKLFYPQSPRAQEFADQVGYPVNMATLQGHLIRYSLEAEEAIAHLDKLHQDSDNEPETEQEEASRQSAY